MMCVVGRVLNAVTQIFWMFSFSLKTDIKCKPSSVHTMLTINYMCLEMSCIWLPRLQMTSLKHMCWQLHTVRSQKLGLRKEVVSWVFALEEDVKTLVHPLFLFFFLIAYLGPLYAFPAWCMVPEQEGHTITNRISEATDKTGWQDPANYLRYW